MVDFKTKFLTARQYNSKYSTQDDVKHLQLAYESDRGRILNSAAVRRLQQKTQVFPLERNAAVRSRLTHSLEVMQVGRYIVQQVFRQLGKDAGDFGLDELERPFETIVEMSCLLHDVGNPPFGHFGEDTIKTWFRQNINQLSEQSAQSLSADLSLELTNFEGNAQGIRIITNLQRLNLTYTQLAAVLKYTRSAADKKPVGVYLQKKPGFYYSEQHIVNRVQQSLAIETGCRHPATYIMEAADDIAYCIADIEDAVEKNIMDIKTLADRLIKRYTSVCETLKLIDYDDGNMSALVQDALENSRKNRVISTSAFFVRLRVGLQSLMVKHAATRFIENIERCYHGNLDEALLEDASKAHAISKTLKEVAREYAFSHPEVEASELQGHHLISGLLDKYSAIMRLSTQQVHEVLAEDYSHPIALRMFKRIAKKHINAYLEAVNESPQLEFYYRCRMVQDHVSGMTDHHAFDEYQMLHVIS